MSLLRVACLYRVSTTAQADHNDIPMQREACQEYAQAVDHQRIPGARHFGIQDPSRRSRRPAEAARGRAREAF